MKMTDAPERIWGKSDDGFDGIAGTWLDESDGPDMVEYVRADLAPSWRPIETAPKDGREVLIFVGGYYIGGVVVAEWREGSGWSDWDADLWNPTHWMPLPAPPTE
jgi:hypothetical protein